MLWPFLGEAFRPFFLGAGTFATIGMLLWLPLFLGSLDLPLGMAPRDWHIHEMVYGYAAAAIAGFLFTAIPNWTGRPPLSGLPLLALSLTWVGGRIAMATSGLIGTEAAALIDLVFLPLVAVMAGRDIVAAGNRRNFKLIAVLALLVAGNVIFYAEVIGVGVADYGKRFGLATVIGLVVLIGGRIVPNFTRNALLRAGSGRLPQPFGRFDVAANGVSVLALGAWVALPHSATMGMAAVLAGILQSVRLVWWAGDRARRDWLVLILHIAYAFVPIGFLLIGLAALAPGTPMTGAGEHAWGVGAIGLMTLAVMTRATLGHTGRQLVASRGTVVVYGLAILATFARIAAAVPSTFDTELLYIAAIAWIASFAGFAVIYGPMMLAPRLGDAPAGC